jgi:hypothetical protein
MFWVSTAGAFDLAEEKRRKHDGAVQQEEMMGQKYQGRYQVKIKPEQASLEPRREWTLADRC